jgi:hypothetical protein
MFQDNNAWINVVDSSKITVRKRLQLAKKWVKNVQQKVLTIVDHTKWKARSRVVKNTNRRRIEVKNL